MSAERPDHYSYTVYADPETARTFDRRRFAGPIGELVADGQARVLLDFVADGLGPAVGRRIIDVGAGTGRASLLMARAGAEVTGVDASSEMLAVARRRADADRLAIDFRLGDAHALAFPDRSFDGAVSLRVLMHTPEWARCLSELCRVSARFVILDYPSVHSFAALESAWRRLTYVCGARTEPYRVFADGAIAGVLRQQGFEIRRVHRQFVLPIAVHKAVGSRRFTEGVERLLARVGLAALLGSPVTVLAERCASS